MEGSKNLLEIFAKHPVILEENEFLSVQVKY